MNKEKNLEMFNAHQADLRGRADSLAKSIFLITGGALTLSFGVILRENGPVLEHEQWALITFSWGCLFLSMVSTLLYLSAMLIRDNSIGEQWRNRIHKNGEPAHGFPSWIDKLIWVLWGFSIFGVIVGMGILFYAASMLIKTT